MCRAKLRAMVIRREATVLDGSTSGALTYAKAAATVTAAGVVEEGHETRQQPVVFGQIVAQLVT
jgi:hypothetical protein